MTISTNINQYIQNSLIRGKLCKWDKQIINVYITQITIQIENKELMYSLVNKAIISWNTLLKNNRINIQFNQIQYPSNADITVNWIQVGRIYEGMCKYLSVIGNSIKKITIEIGLPNAYGKNITELSIYCAIMHEFGHALGLGHGIEINDIMYVPHQKNITIPSENDLYVLNRIYNP